jgi:hypothetical protein
VKLTLRDYQRLAVDDAVTFLGTALPGDKRLYAAPTGTGKSVIELAVADITGGWIVTPRLEIVAGMLQKLGRPEYASEDALRAAGEAEGIYTPTRLRNMLLGGRIDALPPCLILDEGHHAAAETWDQLDLLLGRVPAVAYTASPYRGTPKGTAALRAQWGEPVWVLTYPEAVERGVLSFPECRTVALVDDDEIEVQNGEFVASQVEAASRSAIEHVAELCESLVTGGPRAWDRPTMFAMPSVALCHQMTEALNRRGLPALPVTGDTPHSHRQAAFAACLDRSAALVQVAVVSEGVDLAVRRLIDMAPRMSPVAWLQQFGRITRPGGASEYVCTNRNLLRHGYLLDGCLPLAALAEASAAFSGQGKRAGVRAFGLEALGRLQPVELPLTSGVTATMYAVSAAEGHQTRQYVCLVHPAKDEPIWAERANAVNSEGERQYGRWRRCEAPEGLRGFASLPPGPVSEKQKDWWNKSATRHGLAADTEPNRKVFQALPVLSDLRIRL